MKTRYEFVREYLNDCEDYIDYVADACREAGYESIDDAYESILKHPISYENACQFSGWNSAEDYWIMTLIDGIYEYEKQLIRAHKRYDRIIERLASKKKYNPVVVDEFLKMKERDERVSRELEEVNYAEILDELVSRGV